jgi:hypothetical protein
VVWFRPRVQTGMSRIIKSLPRSSGHAPRGICQGTIRGNSTSTTMNLLQLVFHLTGFALPAVAMAVCMPLAGRWVMGSSAVAWPRRVGLQALVGLLVLLAGLVLQGHDGRMATYAALVLVAATLEWLMHKGWRR